MNKGAPSKPETFTITEVKEILGLGLNQTYQAVERHNLGLRLGRRIVIPRARLERFLAGDK